jgi:hypothetical protein
LPVGQRQARGDAIIHRSPGERLPAITLTKTVTELRALPQK